MFKDTPASVIDTLLQDAWSSFHEYRKLPLSKRAEFMETIASEIENCGDLLIETAMRETHLPEARLRGERARTIQQLNSYAAACNSGEWLEARIDKGNPTRLPLPKPDIRKMLVPLGPVVVFGASNFPFAYSTAGGDTACAFAAGCPVIVKAHPAHAATSTLVANAILTAADRCNMPKGIFAHVYGARPETGKALVTHQHTKAVGFTGSFTGGKQLFDWGNQRKEPIPVFAEMGSVNPVFLLPGKLKSEASAIATMYAGSITMGVGQFCTNPGIIIGLESEALNLFLKSLGEAIENIKPATMLHEGIAKAYEEKSAKAISQPGVKTIAVSKEAAAVQQASAMIATVSGADFLQNPLLAQEVFGPYSLVVKCAGAKEMLAVANQLEGQLTACFMGTDTDLKENEKLVETVKNICGRLIVNAVPTGVEVCLSMHHGGPYPATTDARFSSVGADGIKRFARPLCFQNWSNALLPAELQNENPLGIWRTVDNELSKAKWD